MPAETDDARGAYEYIKQYLRKHDIFDRIEALVIYEAVFGEPYIPFTIRELSASERIALRKVLEKRVSGYPLQYIAGKWPFLDFELSVGEGVLIPRPDTESLAEICIEYLRNSVSPVVIDLCSGSGCLAIAVRRTVAESKVTAVEYHGSALGYLEKNTAANAPDITVRKADVFGFENLLANSSVDMIICNPPYVTKKDYEKLAKELYYEPEPALTDGGDGLSFYRYISENYREKLKPGGFLMFEIGDNTGPAVTKILGDATYRRIEIFNDSFGNPRIAAAVRD